jgi:hypothetical protein
MLPNLRFNKIAVVIQTLQSLHQRHLRLPHANAKVSLILAADFYFFPDFKDEFIGVFPCQLRNPLIQYFVENLPLTILFQGAFSFPGKSFWDFSISTILLYEASLCSRLMLIAEV